MAFTKILFANNAGTALAAAIDAVQTTITVTTGTGALFPSPGANQFFPVTVVDAGTGLLREIMYCTSRTADTLTVTRGQEGTTARAYNIFSPIANLWTAGQAQQIIQAYRQSDDLGGISAIQPYAGNPNGNVAGNAVSGSVPPSMVWDTTENSIWICTTTGNAAAAVWTRNSLMQVYAGNPNGSVAGNQGAAGGASPSFIWDITNLVLWVCTTTGNAAGAVWQQSSGGGTTFCGTSTGSANAQILTPAVPIAGYSAGLSLSFIAGFTNTNALQVNVSGKGLRNVYKDGPTGPIPLTGGEVVAGNIISMRDDGTRFQLTATELGTAALANATSPTGIVAAVFGSGTITPGNFAQFSDAFGTVQDSGISSAGSNYAFALYCLGRLM